MEIHFEDSLDELTVENLPNAADCLSASPLRDGTDGKESQDERLIPWRVAFHHRRSSVRIPFEKDISRDVCRFTRTRGVLNGEDAVIPFITVSPHNGTKTFLSDTESVPITIDTGCELTDTLQTWRLAAVSGDTKSGGGTCQEFVRQREYLMMSKAQSSNQKSFKLYTSQRKETTSRLVPAPRLDRLIGSTSYI
ncbi:hypothetical protein F2P81_019588 [Scophthalmus maximus]|uniref:Uncharacterized protein n=1 Tax=Scophthalmus maximus TaxID=52904 RepID=A0A6A4SBM9_SCOMX|nr:hypothetical protein F2P81_019588 [Scophthalmus maximus]